jgi:hypothetical protein
LISAEAGHSRPWLACHSDTKQASEQNSTPQRQ